MVLSAEDRNLLHNTKGFFPVLFKQAEAQIGLLLLVNNTGRKEEKAEKLWMEETTAGGGNISWTGLGEKYERV